MVPDYTGVGLGRFHFGNNTNKSVNNYSMFLDIF